MKFPIDIQIKLSMALLVLIGTRFTMAEMTDIKKNPKLCQASLTAKFTESAPRDRFEFINVSGEGWQIQKLSLALASSDGNLIFDTEDGGTGVEVFQAYRQESTSATIESVAKPADGDQTIEITFSDFPAGANYTFSIDVDDQLTQSKLGNIRVAGSEINGAGITVDFLSPKGEVTTSQSVFTTDSTSDVKHACP